MDNADCIITTLSGSAQTFSSDYIDNVLGKETVETWAQFVIRLEKYFLDPDAKEKAREKLEHFRQEQKGIVEYLTQREALFNQAELTDDYEKRRLLEKGVKRNIINTLYALNNVKDKYDGLKTDILVLGQS
jgi:hypothetical protein